MKKTPEINQAFMEAHPLIYGLMLVFFLIVVLLLTGFITFWISAIARWSRGAPILAVAPWKPRAWGLIDVVLVLIAAFVGQAVLIPAWAVMSGINLREMAKSDHLSLSIMAVGSGTYLLAMLMGLGWLVIRYAASLQHMGMSLKRLMPNTGIGLVAASMTLPIVALISYGVSEGLKAEYDHPLINELKREGTLSAYLLAVFCAVLVAPLVEEFFFRVLLQGWLQSVPWSAGSWWWLVGSNHVQSTVLMSESNTNSDSDDASADKLQAPVASASADSDAKPAVSNPYDPPFLATAFGPQASVVVLEAVPNLTGDTKPPIWPSFVVGTLFGLAHYDYGLSFIPLIVLGIVLGLLYRATHSIWPSFVLHFALNSISMASLGLTLLLESTK